MRSSLGKVKDVAARSESAISIPTTRASGFPVSTQIPRIARHLRCHQPSTLPRPHLSDAMSFLRQPDVNSGTVDPRGASDALEAIAELPMGRPIRTLAR